jgi:hypothetical protein
MFFGRRQIFRRERAASNTVARPWDGFDLKQTRSNVQGNLAHLCDRAVQAIVSDVGSAPALIKEIISGHHLPRCIEQHQKDLHDQWLDVGTTAGAFDEAPGRTD